MSYCALLEPQIKELHVNRYILPMHLQYIIHLIFESFSLELRGLSLPWQDQGYYLNL